MPAVEPGVGEVGLAARVDGLEQRLAARVLALGPEAHDRVGTRRAELPAGLVAHPALEQLREPHVLADRRLQPGPPEAADHGPQLERAEAAAERRAVLVEIRDALGRGAQVLGRERERRAQVIGPRREDARAVDRREQPLVRVDDERVGALEAGRPELGADARRAGVGGVDVQPRPRGRAASAISGTGSTDVVDVVPRSPRPRTRRSGRARRCACGRRRRPGRGGSRGRGCGTRGRPRSARARRRRPRGGRASRCAPRTAPRASRSRPCPRCGRASRREVEQLAEPRERQLLELRHRGRGLPEHAVRVHRRREQLRQDARCDAVIPK